jgi:hypothetical protein
MVVIAANIIEMRALQQGSGPRAGVGLQTSEQPAQAFSDSLHAAAKASAEPAGGDEASTKVVRRQKPAAQDGKAPVAVPEGSAVLPSPISTQTVSPQQALSTDPSVAPAQLSLRALLASQDALTAVADQPGRGVAAASTSGTSGTASNIVPPGIVQSGGVQSSYAQWGSDPLGAVSMLFGAEVPGTKVPIIPTSAGNSVSSIVANAVPNAVSQADMAPAQTVVPSAALNAVQNAASSSVPNSVPNAVQMQVASTVQNSLPKAVLEFVSSAVPHAPSNAVPVSVPHTVPNESAKGIVAPSLSPGVADQAVPSAPPPEQSVFATGLSVPPATAEQLTALTKLSAGVSSPNSAKPSAKTPISAKDDIGLKPSDKSTPVQAESPTGAQNATSPGGEGQSDSSSQGQKTGAALMDFPNHAVAANVHTQNPDIAFPLGAAPTLLGGAGHAAKPDSAASPANTAPEALPVINTAKLIQSMGQSEMRVGMRSNEFGNISIRTSVTRDLISARISLDNGDLAKALTTHLPEMQTKLGSNQTVNVRIDMNGQGAGQGTGTSGGMSNGSADESRGGRQQAGSAASSGSVNRIGERQPAPVAAAVATGDRLNARLDIRI